MPPNRLRLSSEERLSRAEERIGSGSAGGRIESASPVRRQTPRSSFGSHGNFGDTQRLYAEGDNYGSPIVLGAAGSGTEIPWIQNVDQTGTDIEVESSGGYADIGILFNATGLYSFYVHLETDGDLATGETGTRQFWLEKSEHIIENYNTGGPDFYSANTRDSINATAFDVTCWDRTWLFWMEEGERTLVTARTYGELGTVSVTVSRSFIVVRRLA